MADPYDQELFLEYVEGELAHDKRVEFERLMLQDARLRNLVAQLVIDRHRLRTLPDEDPPPHLMDRVGDRLERLMLLGAEPEEFGKGFSPAQNLRWRRTVALGGLAAMFLVVIGVMIFTLGDLMRGRPRVVDLAHNTRSPATHAPATPPSHSPAAQAPAGSLTASSLWLGDTPVEILRISTDDPGRTRGQLARWVAGQLRVPGATLRVVKDKPGSMVIDAPALALLIDELNAQQGQSVEVVAPRRGPAAFLSPMLISVVIQPEK